MTRVSSKLLTAMVMLMTMVGMLTMTVDVSAASKPKLSKTSITITAGMTQKISVKKAKKSAKITWESSDTSIATVSSKGTIKGVGDGSTTVKCTVVQSGKTYSLTEKVNVKTPALTQDSYALVKGGDKGKISVTTKYHKQKVTYTSANKKIATVSKKGNITAVSTGTTKIKVKVYVPKYGTRSARTITLYAKVNAYNISSVKGKSAREVVSLNGEWSFTDYNNETSTVTVPHDWNYYTAAAAYNPYLISKTVTYEKKIDVSSYDGKEIFLQFGAVNKVAKVYVDDELIGTHTGGYTSFNMDITKACEGKDEVTVKVENTNATFDTIPVNTDFTHYAGIYRDVNLVAVDKDGYLSMEDNGADGVTLTNTVKVSNRKATIKPYVRVSNKTSDAKDIIAKVEIKDANGKTVASGVTAKTIAANKKNIKVKLDNIYVKKAHLWQGTTDPYLYTAVTTIYSNGTVVDQDTQEIGFRNYSVKNGNFYLNGKKYVVHGVGMHQQNNGSYVSTDADIEKSIDDALEMGANALRTSHYPHSQKTYQLCDEKGIVVWCEIPYYLITLDSDTFYDNVKQNLTEMVKQYEKHTSIIVWGIENEVYYPEAYAAYYNLASKEKTGTFMKELAALTKSLDSTRMVGEAQINNLDYADETASWTTKDSGISTVGFNIYAGWYNKVGNATESAKTGIVSNMTNRIKKLSTKFNKSSSNTTNYCMTEYGAGGCIDTHVDLNDESFKWGGQKEDADNGITADNGYLFTTGKVQPEEYQAYVHEADVVALYGDKTTGKSKNANIWGAFAWSLYDFSCYRNEGSTTLTNTKGLITADRKTKKDAFYLYKAIWNTEKYFTHVCSKNYTDRDKQTTDVKVYSNCAKVKLTVNGKSYGYGTKTQDGVFVWKNVKLADSGESNKVTATGYQGSKTYTNTASRWVYTEPTEEATEATE